MTLAIRRTVTLTRAEAPMVDRDLGRLAEIMGLFRELDQRGAVEESLFAHHLRRNAERRRERLDTELLDPGEHKRRCARDRARYARIKSEQPHVYAQILRRVRERYRAWARIHNKGCPRRLTADSARQLREQHAAGVSQKDLAALHGINRKHVGDVLSGKSWPNAGGPIGRHRTPARVLTEAAVLEIRESPEAEDVLATRLCVRPQTIYDVRVGRTWKHVGGRIVARKTALRVPFDKKAYQARWQRENRERHAAANARWYERRKERAA